VRSVRHTGFNAIATIANWSEPYAAITAPAVLVTALVYGGVLTLLYGAPLYAWLQFSGRASWLNVILAGGLPGVVVLWKGESLAIVLIACGVAVACATHIMVRNDVLRNRREATEP
jgi:hypothetical protein